MSGKNNSNYDASQPQYTWGSKWTKLQIADKQADFIMAMAEKANVTIINLDQLSRGGASGLIDELKRAANGDLRSRTHYLPQNFSKFVQVN